MVWKPFRKKRELELEALDRWRTARKLASSDVTDLGEQLAGLQVSAVSHEASQHHRQALDGYEQAKGELRSSATAEDVFVVEQLLADAHYHRAAVLALAAGQPLPERREAGEEPQARMIPVGDRYVPVHEVGGYQGVLDHHNQLFHELATSHSNRKHQAQVDLWAPGTRFGGGGGHDGGSSSQSSTSGGI